jgi:PadR family transcriptional regulator AphA
MQVALEQQRDTEAGFGQILANWRIENVRAAMRFLDDVDTTRPRSQTPPQPKHR